ncbi:MAG: glyoxylate/hydroxypyruvate reductase A [Deltaproteobacteria bacterium]|nr:glyoxylate/hydroxypyruvate reductase A [Deltaproteobacteria bacterium]
MALLVVITGYQATPWVSKLQAFEPKLDIRVWPEVGDPDEIDFALTWRHPMGEFKKYRNLKCIASMGAGVEHILCDPDLPHGVPITRIVEPSMPQSMIEYVVMVVLNYCRHYDLYRKQQIEQQWLLKIPILARNVGIGIMGLGQLGGDAAEKLSHLGFQVAGWNRTPKIINGVKTFSGDDQLNEFLAHTRILICLLPLTPGTKDILNRDLFDKLQPGAYVINVARGEHLVEQDLLYALETGQLSGACLDVFRTEPLPKDHPFWRHPKIVVTPHISSLTIPAAVVPQIIENYHRALSGNPLLNEVDIRRGY